MKYHIFELRRKIYEDMTHHGSYTQLKQLVELIEQTEQLVEHFTGIARSLVRIPFKSEFFSSFILYNCND